MKKLTTLVLSTIFLTSIGVALAQQNTGQNSAGQNRAGQDLAGNVNRCGAHAFGIRTMPALDHLLHAMRQLNLTAAQKTAIQAIMQSLKADISPIAIAMKAAYLQLGELVKAIPYDDVAVADVAIQLGDLTSQQVALVSQAIADILSQLTAEQRAQLAAIIAQWKNQHNE